MKLGLHFQTVPGWGHDLLQSGAFAWCKQIDPPAGPDPWPGVRTIGRIWLGGDAIDQSYVNRCEAGAEAYFRVCLPHYKAAPWVHCWSAANEPTPYWDGLQRLNRFSRRWVELMHSEGLRAVVGELSVGQPNVIEGKPPAEQSDIRVLADALVGADYWSLHEYGAGSMRYGETWLCLRYRRHIATLRAAGIRIPGLLITECGVDGGAVIPGDRAQPGLGWQSYGLSEEQYMAQLAWYTSELAKDPEVQAAFVFTAGPTADWRGFDVPESLARKIAQWNLEHRPVSPPAEGLPEDETATNPATIAEKARWWQEEMQRMFEAGRVQRAEAIRLSLIKLLYRLEQQLKEGV